MAKYIKNILRFMKCNYYYQIQSIISILGDKNVNNMSQIKK